MTPTATSQATLGPDEGEVIEGRGNRLRDQARDQRSSHAHPGRDLRHHRGSHAERPFPDPCKRAARQCGLARISTFAREHRDVILISAWLQVTGAILYVVFILAIVHLAGAGQRFAGRIVALAAAILVGLTLLDSAMIISTVQSAAQGHNETLRVSFDLMVGPGNDAIGRSFLIAPAILLPLGFVILQNTTAAPQLRVDRARLRRR